MGVTSQDAAGRLGENVRQLRLLRSMTQEQISRLAGLPRATWANLESGTANPTLTVLQRVAMARAWARREEGRVPLPAGS